LFANVSREDFSYHPRYFFGHIAGEYVCERVCMCVYIVLLPFCHPVHVCLGWVPYLRYLDRWMWQSQSLCKKKTKEKEVEVEIEMEIVM